jgi:prepilin-type N-terminal cleavage/methylation domain-containing protein
MSKRFKQQAGFTVLELLVATMVFSVVLLLLTFGILQIGRIYYKGVTSASTQETARTIMDTVARDIQFSGGAFAKDPTPPGDGATGFYCVGNHRYSYILDRQLASSPALGIQSSHGLVVDDESPCNFATGPQNFMLPTLDPGSRELLGTRMRIDKFVIEEVPGSTGSYNITLRIVYGDNDLLDFATHSRCNSGAGSAFCAVSELTTTVKKRV